MKTNRFNIRASALAGVSAAALIVAASTVWSAPAPQTSYSLDLTGVLATVATQTEYLIDVTVLPDPQIAPTAAVITGSSVTNVFGSGTGFAAQASNNVFTSTAISNKATSVLPSDRIVDLSLIGNDGTNDGIGILQDQMTGVAGAVTPVPITSSVTGGAFTNSLTNFSTGSVDTSNNLLAASTTVNLITPDNGEKFLVELENCALTNIPGFQAKQADLTLTINRSDLEQTMMGRKQLEAQIADGTAKAEGDVSVLGKLAALMVEFDPRFEVLPGTKFRPEQIAHAEPFEAIPTKAIPE